MKIKNKYIGAAMLLSGGLMASCSSDYLDVKPVTDLGSSVVADNVDGAQVALNGICRAMYDGYSVGANQDIGETYINTVFNDTFGPDYFGNLTTAYFTATNFNWGAMTNTNTWYTQVLWMYPYNIINQANAIIDGVTDNTAGPQAEKDFIVAQALTLRAHAYIKLLQFYAPRWEDSKNGETYVCVLRLKVSNDDLALSKMSEVLDQIYADLDRAIGLYDGASGISRGYKWAPDKSVAQGLYARAALIKHDWAKAQQMAHDARQGYRPRNATELFEGFVEPMDDDMWCNSNATTDVVGYWSWGVHFACNGRYTQTWQLGTGAIAMDLYRQLDPNDIRRDWFFTPDKLDDVKKWYEGYYKKTWPYNLTEADFWNKNYILSATTRANGNLLMAAAYYSMYQFYEVNTNPDKTDWYMPYLDTSNGIGVRPVFFGSQYKFWGKGGYSAHTYPYMRSAEMVLAEAEAAYMNGDETTAKSCLTELNKLRIPNYSCTTSGDALLKEIQLTRRIELWGEGQNWSDFKRWNLPMVRNPWIEGNVNSGNCPATYKVNFAPSDFDGWRWGLSRTESDYNPEVKPEMFYQ